MAINHVRSQSNDISFPVEKYFFLQFGLNEEYKTLTKEENEIIELINSNLNIHLEDNAISGALHYLNNNNRNPVAKILYNLLSTFDTADSLYCKDQSLFISRALDPFLNVIFSTGSALTRDGHFACLTGSADIKPDIKFSAKVGLQAYDLLLFEVKCPNSAKDDFFKMSVELQFMINRMIENNIDKPVVYGVVGKEWNSSLLLICVLLKVRSFYLPRSTYDLTVTLTTIPALLQLRQLTINQVYRARRSILSGENEQREWTRTALISTLKASF